MLFNLIFGPQHTTARLNTLLPDIHKCTGQIRVSPDFPVLIKTHYLLTPQMPLFGNTAGFIYIVRNPMDAMMSNLNYLFTVHGTEKDPALRKSIKQQYIEEFITQGGDPNWIRFGRGSWIEHVTSWVVNQPGFPGLLLRYDDLCADAVAQLQRMNGFLGLGKTMPEVEEAVSLSTFDRMKSIEEQELASRTPGFFMSENYEKSILQGNRFMNRGKVGEGENELTPAQRERFLDKFGSTMKMAGYL
jgi:hypothetical protein